jgi:lysophospholipase L1-like esterase
MATDGSSKAALYLALRAASATKPNGALAGFGLGGAPTVAPSTPDFPTTLTGLLMWIDGRDTAYTDAAGTAVATPYTVAGRVRRINYMAPAVGNAQAPSAGVRPWREFNSLNFEIGATTYLNAPVASNCTQDAITIAMAFSTRDKPAGSPQSLFCNGNIIRIWTFSDNIIAINCNGTGTFWLAGPPGGGEPYARAPLGAQVEMVFRLSATELRVAVAVNGMRTDYQKTVTVLNTNLPAANWQIGTDGVSAGQDYLVQAAISQAMLINRVCTDAEVDGLMTFMRANPAPALCPTAIPCITISGDSIAASSAGVFGVPLESRWGSLAQIILNATQPVNVINAAISGDSLVHQRDVTYPAVLAQFYNASRAKNIAVLAAGTNDIATLSHTGAVVLADQYTFADAMLASGKKPVVCTILARNPGGGFDAANFATQQTYYNTQLRAAAAARGYQLCDFAAIPQLSDPTNTTYYSDGIHPTVAGHALMAVVAAAAIQATL